MAEMDRSMMRGEANPALASLANHYSRQDDLDAVPLCILSDSWDSDSFLGVASSMESRGTPGWGSYRGEDDMEEDVVVRRRPRRRDSASHMSVSSTPRRPGTESLLAPLTPLAPINHMLQDDFNKENVEVPPGVASLLTAPMVSPTMGVIHPTPPPLISGGGLQFWKGSRTPLSPLTPGDGSPAGCLKRPLHQRGTAESLTEKRRRMIAPPLAPSSRSPNAPSPLSPPNAFGGIWDHDAVQQALETCMDEDKMLGDFSRPCSLPTISGKHQDLNYITQDTMATLLKGELSASVPRFLVLDCRYPYEFEGGHVRGALNLFREEQLVQQLLRGAPAPSSPASEQLVLVFYCEFSSERGPRQCQTLRRLDREVNSYPSLHYPEMYVLKGGYKDFFPHSPALCDPSAYRPMRHKDFEDQLRRFHNKSRSLSHMRPRSSAVALLTRLHTA